jgi:hypothetical protein
VPLTLIRSPELPVLDGQAWIWQGSNDVVTCGSSRRVRGETSGFWVIASPTRPGEKILNGFGYAARVVRKTGAFESE